MDRSNGREEKLCYGIVGNIPKEFHSADLRAMFSNFINSETDGFRCFHFRHRPEFKREKEDDDVNEETCVSSTTCCVILILEAKLQELIAGYHGKNWVDRKGKYHPSKAVISKIRVKAGEDSLEDHHFRTRKEKRNLCFTRTALEFSQHDLKDLIELQPPPLMPNGNVGTPLAIFKELIRACKLPPHVITKLDLDFSAGKSRKKYTNVPLDYKSIERGRSGSFINRETEKKEKTSDFVKKRDNDRLGESEASSRVGEEASYKDDRLEDNDSDVVRTCSVLDNDNDLDDNVIDSDNKDDDAEEWDRHESLHNDVTSQERTKERLFEEEIELKWEKGGSGLVFYTDAAFWKQQEAADFDEETADDWDVDMEIYDDPDGGDKDARDLLQMRLESQWRKGRDIVLNKIGGFEKHTRGFGSQVMKKHGWEEGSSLGSSQVGIKEPVLADGQFPKCKRGLGYYGEKLERHVKRPRAERDVIISTVYDKLEGQEDPLFQSPGPDKLKYIRGVNFVYGETTNK